MRKAGNMDKDICRALTPALCSATDFAPVGRKNHVDAERMTLGEFLSASENLGGTWHFKIEAGDIDLEWNDSEHCWIVPPSSGQDG